MRSGCSAHFITGKHSDIEPTQAMDLAERFDFESVSIDRDRGIGQVQGMAECSGGCFSADSVQLYRRFTLLSQLLCK